MKKILLLSVLSIVVVMQSVIAQNNYRDFEFTIDTTGYYFWFSDDFLSSISNATDIDWIEPGIVDMINENKYDPSDYVYAEDSLVAPSLLFEERTIILPYNQVIDSCVLTLHDVCVWKENIVLSTNQNLSFCTSESESDKIDFRPKYMSYSKHLPKKMYSDDVYPLSGQEIQFINDIHTALPMSILYVCPFIYDSYKKTLKIASSVTVRVYYKEGDLYSFDMETLDQKYIALFGDVLLNPEDLDEYLRQADTPINENSSGMVISQSGRECIFQFAQPLSENANLYLYKTDGTLYRTILVEQGATSLAVTFDDPGMYLYCIQNRKGKIIIAD